MHERSCTFCKAYKFRIELDSSTAGLIHKHTVALVSRAKRPGEKSFRGRITDYNAAGAGFKLNYCPECGRSLKKLRRNRGAEMEVNDERIQGSSADAASDERDPRAV